MFRSKWVPGVVAVPVLVGTFLGTGCVSQRQSFPQRTAAEQLLLSSAASRAVDDLDLSPLRGKKVYIDPAYFESYDKPYVLGTLRAYFIAQGVYVFDKSDAADIIVEPRSAALSTDSSDSLTGIPSLPVPIPFSGVTKTPEVPFFKSVKQESIAKLYLVAYEKESREHVTSTPPLVGEAFLNYYQVLGLIKFRTSDIPEKKMWRRNK